MKFLTILFLAFLSISPAKCQVICNYRPFTGWGICINSSEEVICLREFIKGGHSFYFTVSPKSLNTEIVRSDSINVISLPWESIRSRYHSTPYCKALMQAEKFRNLLQDAGLTRFRASQKGIDLTVDLCPSQRHLDRIVFTDLIKEVGGVEKPVPLSVSITGRWIIEHPADLNWLDSLVRAGDLSIVWINHSYNHFTSRDVPLKMNFMLAPGTDINNEVLKTEVALLMKNIMPSVFFRFPGLVSDNKIYENILNLGLIPIGSDAWLAKGQWPKNGSIVLIHANGNEQLGVRDFIDLLKSKRSDVLSKRWELFDLRESLVDYN